VKKWLIPTIIGAVMLLACCGIGGAIFSGMGAPDNPTPTPASVATSAAHAPAAPSKAAKPAAAKGVKDGEWLVGTDVPAGRYQSSGPDGNYMCYWQLTTEAGAQPGEQAFLSNDAPPGHAYVTLKKGEYFKTSHCGPWTLVAP
jgi:hypothetical protein